MRMLSSDYPRRLVIIDDNPTDVTVLQRAIREIGLNVEIVVVEDGDKAIQYFENCREESLPIWR